MQLIQLACKIGRKLRLLTLDLRGTKLSASLMVRVVALLDAAHVAAAMCQPYTLRTSTRSSMLRRPQLQLQSRSSAIQDVLRSAEIQQLASFEKARRRHLQLAQVIPADPSGGRMRLKKQTRPNQARIHLCKISRPCQRHRSPYAKALSAHRTQKYRSSFLQAQPKKNSLLCSRSLGTQSSAKATAYQCRAR